MYMQQAGQRDERHSPSTAGTDSDATAWHHTTECIIHTAHRIESCQYVSTFEIRSPNTQEEVMVSSDTAGGVHLWGVMGDLMRVCTWTVV